MGQGVTAWVLPLENKILEEEGEETQQEELRGEGGEAGLVGWG